MSKSMSKDELSTIRMMKLYQSNVKQDISNTSDVIKLVQEKLNTCSLSLASLKQVTNELNSEYKDLESKVDTLGHRVKEMSSSSDDSASSSMSRTSSLSSLVDQMSETGTSVFDESGEYDDLDSTYIFVHGKADGTASEDELERAADTYKWQMKKKMQQRQQYKRKSIGTVSSSSSEGYHDDGWSSSTGSGSSNSGDDYAQPNCFDENDRIIKSLQRDWTANP